MTRLYVYSAALVAFVGSTAMILAATAVPRWITYSVHAGDQTFQKHIGLHQSCSNLDDPPCRPFPYKELCQEGERYFCSMWRTVAFLAALAALMCLAGIVTFGVVMKGGKYKRETSWPFIAFMMAIVSALEFSVISIVAYLFENDDQFTIPGWSLDVSWIISTVSASVCLVAAIGLVTSAYLLPPEEGYDFLEDPLDS